MKQRGGYNDDALRAQRNQLPIYPYQYAITPTSPDLCARAAAALQCSPSPRNIRQAWTSNDKCLDYFVLRPRSAFSEWTSLGYPWCHFHRSTKGSITWACSVSLVNLDVLGAGQIDCTEVAGQFPLT